MFTLIGGSIARMILHRPFTTIEIVELVCCFGGEIAGSFIGYEIGKAVGKKNA